MGASRGWFVGAIVSALLVVAATASAGVLSDPGWAGLAVVGALSAVVLVVVESRRPRRVSASPAGVEVLDRRHARLVPWDRLRRVRGPRAVGFDRLDTYLELDTGELVRLPRRTPGGVVEGWRARQGGDGPVSQLPQVWRLTPEEAQQQSWLLPNGVLLLSLAAVNVANAVLDMPAPAFFGVYLAALLLLGIATWRRPARAIEVDEHEMAPPGWRQKPIRWSDVQDVRRKGRYEPEIVVELSSGGQREIVGPDLDVVTGWWHLAVPPERR